MEFKSKFDKSKCWRCKYHCYMGNLSGDKSFDKMTDLEKGNIGCYHSVMKSDTCIKGVGKRKTDQRGNDYYNCKLFEENTVTNQKASETTFGRWTII